MSLIQDKLVTSPRQTIVKLSFKHEPIPLSSFSSVPISGGSISYSSIKSTLEPLTIRRIS